MAINPKLLEILACPETHQALHLADDAFVLSLNSRIQTKAIRNRNNEVVAAPITGALIREDKKVAYPIRDDIPVLLVEEGIPLAA